MHPILLRELADLAGKILSLTCENWYQSGEFPGDWRRGNIVPNF